MSICQFEHLSNEVLYEIFEYLDICVVYNTFSTLNIRFRNLLNNSLPLKLNLSWTSKSTFEHYYNSIVLPNKSRTISLNIPNPMIIKFFHSLFSIDQSFIRLESINLGKMSVEHVTLLLTHLQTLPRLFSLSLNVDNAKESITRMFQSILLLPVLKYCRITSECEETLFSTPFIFQEDEKQESVLEYLVINGVAEFDQLSVILLHTPRLVHLSCHSLHVGSEQIQLPRSVNNLKRLFIQLDAIPFNIFESFIIQVCGNLEVLHISAKYEKTYLDAKRWEQLISCQMPNLRILDFQFKSQLFDRQIQSKEYDKLIEQFNNEFWYQRKWFFASQNCRSDYGSFKFFYSVNPYRRKYYKLYEYTNENSNQSIYEDNAIHSSHHISVENQWENKNCSMRFPYATKLTLDGSLIRDVPMLIRSLNSILTVTQITELNIVYDFLFMNKLIMLLQNIPNIRSLTIPQTAVIQNHKLSDDENTAIDLISKTNRIQNVSVVDKECSTIRQLQFLFNLCPQIERLTLSIAESNEAVMMKYLFSKMKETNYRFYLLCINRWDANNELIRKTQSIIENHQLIDNYSLELCRACIYVWC